MNPTPDDDLIRQAEAFERHLNERVAASWSGSLNVSRIASVLKILNATLRPEKTHSPGGVDVSSLVDLPPMVGRFRVGEKIGEGSFGVVHRARDTVLDRDVALKAVPLRPEMQEVDLRAANDDYRMIEARAAAKLNHPNLVPLYEVLEDDHCLYLVSEFCDGPNLAEYLKQHPSGMPVDWAAEVTLNLAQAVAHAHGRGLIHRDIKPGNVLLSPETATGDLLPFTPRLTDFGLVLDADNDLDLQANHRLAGTILYMSPEQVMGDRTADAKSGDVYALGLILYQMLAGRLPYRSSSTLDLMQELCAEAIEPIPKDDKPISRDLHAIYLKALQKDPADRYLTAQEMTDDLLRYRDGREVVARPRSTGERIFGAMRREPVVSSLGAMLVALIIGSLFLFGWNNRQLRMQGRSLAEALHAASQSKREAIEVAYHSDLQKAYRANIEGDTATARATIREVDRYSRGVIDNRYDLKLIKSLSNEGWFDVDRMDHPITEIVLVPGTDCFAVSSEDNIVRIYRDDGRLVRTISTERGSAIHALAASPDGRWIAVGSAPPRSSWWFGDSGSVRFFETMLESTTTDAATTVLTTADVDLKDVLLVGFKTTIESLAFSCDGKLLAVGSRYEPVRVFDLTDPSTETIVDNTRRSDDLSFTPDGHLLLAPHPGQAVLRHVEDDREMESLFETELQSARRLTCSADGRWVATVLVDDEIIHLLHRSDDGNRRYTLDADSGSVNSLRFCDRGDSLVCGTIGGTIAIWKLVDVQSHGSNESIGPTKKQVIHSSNVNAIARDRFGNIISGAADGSVIVWHPDQSRSSKQHLMPSNKASSMTMMPDASSILVTHVDGSVERVDFQTRDRMVLRQPDGDQCRSICVSGDGRWVAIGFLGGKVLVGSLNDSAVGISAPLQWTALPAVSLEPTQDTVPESIAFTPSGDRMCVVRGRYHVQWIELRKDADSSFIHAAETNAFRSKTSIEAMATMDNDTVMLIGDVIRFSHPDAKVAVDATRGVDAVASACYDPSQRIVYLGCRDGRVRVLNADGELIASSERWNSTPTTLPAERTIRGITSMRLSPDGFNLIAGSSEGEVAIWDAKTLRMIGVIDKGNGIGLIGHLSISDDGQTLATLEREHHFMGKTKGRMTVFQMSKFPKQVFMASTNSHLDQRSAREPTHAEHLIYTETNLELP